jgi:glycosyltransferase involved in cell wall biosynthesis
LTVLYPGVDERFFHPLDLGAAAPLREAYGLDRYLLFVGVLSPIKNLEGILHAYARVRTPGLKLAIVGREYGTYCQDVIKPLIGRLQIEDGVALLGEIPDEVLPGMYAGAKAVLYPSFAEGFGLPPVEAMACGTPVIASNVSSLPEALGDAGLLVDPLDIGAIAEGIERVLSDSGLRHELVERGRARAGRFRWSAAASKALEAYASVA